MRRVNGQDVSVQRLSAIARTSETPSLASEPVPDPVEQLRQDRLSAEEQGRRDGLSKGLADAKKEIETRSTQIEKELRTQYESVMRELEDTKSALTALIGNLGTETERLARQAEEVAVEAAYAAVLKVLGDRAADRTLMHELCLHALACAEQNPTALRVSIPDRASIGDEWKNVLLIADARLAPGQCALETRLGHYETGLDVRLEVLKNAFLEGLQQHRSAEA